MYASVIVDIVHSNVDKIFDYKFNNDLQIALGHRVLVPFGFSDKLIEGFVIGVKEETDYDESKIKYIDSVLDKYPVLKKDQIDLAFFMQKEYGATMAECFRLMLPMRLHGLREKHLNVARVISGDDSSFYNKNGTVKAKVQKQVYDFLLEHGETLVCDIENEMQIKSVQSAVKGLEQKGLVEVRPKEIFRIPYKDACGETKRVELNEEQKNAIQTITSDMNGVYLIHGITGSGKTEVYLSLVEKAIEDGKGCIILVPEIALTPQAVERYRARFGDKVALLHSRLSPGERFDQWRLVLQGECNVVLGPRSAVFSPISNLGLIVIDEEHETSYSSDTFPRYSALEVAKFRVENKGVLVLGSATPDIETYYKTTTNEIRLVELTKRANKMPVPKTYVVDMAEELSNGNRKIISNLLYDKINERLQNKEQVILLLNKRGYASFVMCRGCGHVIKCDNCDVSLAYHKANGNKVTCHYCGLEKETSKLCPSCGKPFLKHFGAGTQQVEEQVNELFPNAKTIRMDFDTTREKDAHYKIFNSFINKEYDILIGTQMIAKGLDFPDVTLVGIISADNMLNLPDYKSNERAFSLITQASGRAGRSNKAGEVVIQTYMKDDPVLRLAMEQNYKEFYNYEISLRNRTDYPPFTVFARIISLSKDCNLAFEELRKINNLLVKRMEKMGENKLIYAFGKCPISMINGNYRYQILMKLKNNKECKEFILELMKYTKNYNTNKNVYLDFEINPKNMI